MGASTTGLTFRDCHMYHLLIQPAELPAEHI
jgi:hypothetical protein